MKPQSLEGESGEQKEVVVLTDRDRQKAFFALAMHLRTLFSLQDFMGRLATQMEVLLRQRTQLAPDPVRSQRARRVDQDAVKSVLGESHPLLQIFKGLEDHYDASEGLAFPSVSEQCGSGHWKLISRASQDLGDALCRVTQIVTDGRVTDITVQKSQKHGVWTMQLLQRDLESIIPLVRCAGKLCEVTSDFGDAREPVSAANLAYVGKRLDECAADLSESSDFFANYLKQHPKSTLTKLEQKFIRDMRNIEEVYNSIKTNYMEEVENCSPPIIATMMDMSEDTVLRCIKRMEGNFNRRVEKDIREMKAEMKRDGRDPKHYQYEFRSKEEKIKEEKSNELRPHEVTGERIRRRYKFSQAQRIVSYFRRLRRQ